MLQPAGAASDDCTTIRNVKERTSNTEHSIKRRATVPLGVGGSYFSSSTMDRNCTMRFSPEQLLTADLIFKPSHILNIPSQTRREFSKIALPALHGAYVLTALTQLNTA